MSISDNDNMQFVQNLIISKYKVLINPNEPENSIKMNITSLSPGCHVIFTRPIVPETIQITVIKSSGLKRDFQFEINMCPKTLLSNLKVVIK